MSTENSSEQYNFDWVTKIQTGKLEHGGNRIGTWNNLEQE